MNLMFVPTRNPRLQGDFLEVSILHGLRSILGIHCVDIPKKKIMYHDWSETKKEELHGKGFTLYTKPLQDFSDEEYSVIENFDVVLYGDGHMYGESDYEDLKGLTDNIWHLDGHDLYGTAPRMIRYNNEVVIGTQFDHCFKRELIDNSIPHVYPTGFGIPAYQIRQLDFNNKDQLFQNTAPSYAMFNGSNPSVYKFNNEIDYYKDMQRSWFGLTCIKGGWDCLRHYEILAAGACLLFRDYNKKPPLCSPQDLPCYSYSSPQELYYLTNELLLKDGKPTPKYYDMIYKQREWLLTVGTTEARALSITRILSNYIRSKQQ